MTGILLDFKQLRYSEGEGTNRQCSGLCSVWTVNSSVCEQSGQCSASRDCLSGEACRANLISTRVAAQDWNVQQDSFQGSGRAVDSFKGF